MNDYVVYIFCLFGVVKVVFFIFFLLSVAMLWLSVLVLAVCYCVWSLVCGMHGIIVSSSSM